MRDYALPRLARKRVDAITTADIMAVLLPILSTKRETARRVRQRIGVRRSLAPDAWGVRTARRRASRSRFLTAQSVG